MSAELTTIRWEELPCAKNPPLRQYSAVAAVGQQVFLFGGESPNGLIIGDVSVYDLQKQTWYNIKSTGTPSPRRRAVCSSTGDYTIVYGGDDGETVYGDLYGFDSRRDRWALIRGENQPPARTAAGGCVLGAKHLFIYGGLGSGNLPLNDAYLFDMQTGQWIRLAPMTPLPAISGHTIVAISSDTVILIDTERGERVALISVDSLALTVSMQELSVGSCKPLPKCGVTSVNGTVVLVGGMKNGAPVSDVYALDISKTPRGTASLQKLPELPIQASCLSVVPLPDSSVCVVCGTGITNSLRGTPLSAAPAVSPIPRLVSTVRAQSRGHFKAPETMQSSPSRPPQEPKNAEVSNERQNQITSQVARAMEALHEVLDRFNRRWEVNVQSMIYSCDDSANDISSRHDELRATLERLDNYESRVRAKLHANEVRRSGMEDIIAHMESRSAEIVASVTGGTNALSDRLKQREERLRSLSERIDAVKTRQQAQFGALQQLSDTVPAETEARQRLLENLDQSARARYDSFGRGAIEQITQLQSALGFQGETILQYTRTLPGVDVQCPQSDGWDCPLEERVRRIDSGANTSEKRLEGLESTVARQEDAVSGAEGRVYMTDLSERCDRLDEKMTAFEKGQSELQQSLDRGLCAAESALSQLTSAVRSESLIRQLGMRKINDTYTTVRGRVESEARRIVCGADAAISSLQVRTDQLRDQAEAAHALTERMSECERGIRATGEGLGALEHKAADVDGSVRDALADCLNEFSQKLAQTAAEARDEREKELSEQIVVIDEKIDAADVCCDVTEDVNTMCADVESHTTQLTELTQQLTEMTQSLHAISEQLDSPLFLGTREELEQKIGEISGNITEITEEKVAGCMDVEQKVAFLHQVVSEARDTGISVLDVCDLAAERIDKLDRSAIATAQKQSEAAGDVELAGTQLSNVLVEIRGMEPILKYKSTLAVQRAQADALQMQLQDFQIDLSDIFGNDGRNSIQSAWQLLVLNSDFPSYSERLVRGACRVVFADGAANRCTDEMFEEIRFNPKQCSIVGDLDSVSRGSLERFASLQVNAIRDPNQNNNDFEKCLIYMDRAMPLYCMGVLGGRADQAFCNVSGMLMAAERFQKPIIGFSYNDEVSLVMTKGAAEVLVPYGYSMQNFGIFPLHGTARVKSNGLQWNLDGQIMMGSFISSSNFSVTNRVRIETDDPIIVVFLVEASGRVDCHGF